METVIRASEATRPTEQSLVPETLNNIRRFLADLPSGNPIIILVISAEPLLMALIMSATSADNQMRTLLSHHLVSLVMAD